MNYPSIPQVTMKKDGTVNAGSTAMLSFRTNKPILFFPWIAEGVKFRVLS
jgi:hypothetical protein